MVKFGFKKSLGFIFILSLSATSLLATTLGTEDEDSRPIKRVRRMPDERHHFTEDLPNEISLPNEIYCMVFSYLEPLDLTSIALVSKHFHALSYEDLVWKSIYESVSQRVSKSRIMGRKQSGMQEKTDTPAIPLKQLVKQLTKREELSNPWLVKFYNDTHIPLRVGPILALPDEDTYGYNSARGTRRYISIEPKETVTIRALDWDQDEVVGGENYAYPDEGSDITFEEYKESSKFDKHKSHYDMHMKDLFRGERGYLQEVQMGSLRNSISIGKSIIIGDVLIDKSITLEDTSPIKSIYRFYLSNRSGLISSNGIKRKINWILCIEPRNRHEFMYRSLDSEPTKRSKILPANFGSNKYGCG